MTTFDLSGSRKGGLKRGRREVMRLLWLKYEQLDRMLDTLEPEKRARYLAARDALWAKRMELL